MKKRTVLAALVAILLGAVPAWAGDTVYVDLSGIDTAFPDLTPEQRQQLKDLIVADMQANFDVAGVDITVTTDASADADRTVHISDDMGTHQRSNGTTGYHYGEWSHGSDECNVHLDNFTDRHGNDYKDAQGNWDLDKLRKGIGRTAAHEIAHSYSVGHNDEGADPDKMTEGGLVSSSTRANTEWIFDDHTGTTMNENLGKDPCATAADYDSDYLLPVFTWPPLFPNPDWDPNDPNSDPFNDLDEYGNFDARLFIDGPLTDLFDLGWYGRDTDNGIEDGNPDFDFIYKASMAEPTPPDMLTFFEDAHATAQFVLRGRLGSPWEGDWFPMSEAQLSVGDPTVTPGGEDIYRMITLSWDVDGDEIYDVIVTLESNMLYPYGAEFNGWRVEHAWPCLGDLDGDYDVDLSDLAQLLANYGTQYGALYGEGDLDGDRDVDLSDLAALLAVYGTSCPGEPDFVIDAPYTSEAQSTCGAGDHCSPPSQPGATEDHTYQVNIPVDGEWTFSLCASAFDTWMAVGTTLCGEEIGWSDNDCGAQSELTAFLTAGTYYVDVEGIGACGDYVLEIFQPSPQYCVPAGQDCWHTPGGGTFANFATDPVPSDFFGPGSDPFEGQVALESGTGTTDTIIARLGEMCFNLPEPSASSVPIEIVELNLVSSAPIMVTSSLGDPTYWHVQVSLSPVVAPPGVLNATKEHVNGGTFTAQFNLQPRYTFTLDGDPTEERIWDTGLQGIPPIMMQTAGNAPWSTDETCEVCTFDGWVAGVTENATGDACGVQVCFASALPGQFGQCVIPPACPPCSDYTPPCSACGAGAHWVDTCMGGADYVPVTATLGIDVNFDCVEDMTVVLLGPATVNRGSPLDDSIFFPGTRPIDGHLDVVDTEIIEMSLTDGNATMVVGAGLGQGEPLAPSLGNYAEQVGDPWLIDSFFDVYCELDLGGGRQYYNQVPISLEAVIPCAPPDELYTFPADCIPLFDSPIPGQGSHTANLILISLDSHEE